MMNTPESRGASRLGWVMIGAFGIGVETVCLWGGSSILTAVIVGGVCGFIIAMLQKTLYRWTTAPEREEETEKKP